MASARGTRLRQARKLGAPVMTTFDDWQSVLFLVVGQFIGNCLVSFVVDNCRFSTCFLFSRVTYHFSRNSTEADPPWSRCLASLAQNHHRIKFVDDLSPCHLCVVTVSLIPLVMTGYTLQRLRQRLDATPGSFSTIFVFVIHPNVQSSFWRTHRKFLVTCLACRTTCSCSD